ncbi:4Fe-4S dicluster domain-containing protein [Halanaeroarchaeum sulfurireducens]|uniref:4Fe-4S ferredoxin iron-sulfur binding domain-containing protein n=1 Tax=Halanaeroarchaeum sulfurireducens TaxID=1604004 RepID=A0A0F7PAL3_9EURY|nr:4Fe-4S dicluster domain-containing protein [Halanaeroarchaeum sulfurireducens]AKH97772.1 4Fe-4S ferredoxin iron-sulfur binding domain-containing protein [Halanaeroarchaeum sulfurireducens]ALG82167.1 4Fe-4S ferredoxin iron-sulfur binding domain-containing protein [Halanaeroarchaeum sulfurireducens]
MAQEWGFYFDPEKCIGCSACQVACKNRHGVDPGPVDWRRVETVSQGEFPDYEETTVSISCMHCADAPCENVCPTGAINKRDSDGIVTVDQDKCIGCKYCGWACPFGAPQYGDDGLMQKCNLCLGEGPGSGSGQPTKKTADNGGTKPACVDTCVGGALEAGPISDLLDGVSQAAAERFGQGSSSANVIVEPTTSDGGMGPADITTPETGD